MAASTDALHTHAVKAEEHLEQLATGIASVGADDAAVQAVTQMAKACRQIATTLAKGGTNEGPEHAAEQERPAPRTTDEAISAHMQQRRAAPPA